MTSTSRKFVLPVVLAALSTSLQASTASDCVTDASAFHGVNDMILRAILWNESGMKAHAINRNANGTVDVGIAQINSIHFGRLKQYGIHPEHLMHACVGTYVAAWHLRQQVELHGNTWKAVGAYHSLTPHFNQTYANRVHATLVKWKVLQPGPPPFANVKSELGPTTSRKVGRAAATSSAAPIVSLAND